MAMDRFRNAIASGVSPVTATLQNYAGIPELNALGASAIRESSGTGGAGMSNLEKIIAGKKRAIESGASPEELKLFDVAAAHAASGSQTKFSVDPSGKVEFTQGAAGAEPTVATQTRGQEKLVQYENAVQAIANLQSQLKPEHVGIRGQLGSVVVDKTLSQFIPGAAEGDRIEARDAIGFLRASLLNVVTSDSGGRSSAAERAELAKSLPSLGMIESYPTAMGALNTMRKELNNRAGVYARSIDKEPPLWTLTPQQILDMYNNKKIDYKQTRDVLQRFYGGH